MMASFLLLGLLAVPVGFMWVLAWGLGDLFRPAPRGVRSDRLR